MDKRTASDSKDAKRTAALDTWLIQQGLDGTHQRELLQGYCQKLIEIGIPLFRLHVAQRAFHPQFGGIGFEWLRSGGVSQEHFEQSDSPPERWMVSPLYAMLRDNIEEMRVRLTNLADDNPYPMLAELRARGATDYFATRLLFEKVDADLVIDPNNTPEGALITWSGEGPDGFTDADLDIIRRTLPSLGLALKSASNRQMARDLLQIYLGKDAGTRVLSGDINRGSLQQINAVICYFDLTGFTSLSERIGGEALIALLNDYFGLAVALIQKNGGNVLKFMGDGLLAIFDHKALTDATGAALQTARALRREMAEKNVAREANGVPTTGFTLALHAGEVLYGNIGSESRLDFTVIGPAVNLAARISGMHRSVDQSVIVSQTVYDAAKSKHSDLVSLGRFMLRGVSEPHELFTIYQPE